MIKRILITGGSGFVGGHVANLANNSFEVHAVYNQNPLNMKNIYEHQFDLSELAQIDNLLNHINPDIIIHSAAIANPDRCEDNRDAAIRINLAATEALTTWSDKNGARFIFTSTDMVFDGSNGNYHENDSPNPISFYSVTKVNAENYIKNNHCNHVIARVALVYGIGITRHESFFEKMIEKLKIGESVILFHDQYRSPILVDNLAEALLELADNDFVGIIHLAGSERISRYEFGLRTSDILNLSTENIVKGSMFDFAAAAFRPQDVSLDNHLAKNLLKVNLLNCDEGLKKIRDSHFTRSNIFGS